MKLALLAASIMLLTSCITLREKRSMQSDLQDIKVRLLKYEQSSAERSKIAQSKGDSANLKLASTASDLERLSVQISRLRGDIDALKIGVQTGQMPGVDQNQPSVANTIAELSAKIETLEEGQEQILIAIRESKKSSSKTSKSRQSAKNLDGLRERFDNRQYNYVIEDFSEVIRKAAKRDKIEIYYLNAESMYKVGRIRDAALAFNEFLEMKPKGQMLRHAKLRMGDCFRHLGDSGTAKLYYDELISEFKSSNEAKIAQKRLAKIK